MSSFDIVSVQLLEPNSISPETVNSDWPAGVWLMSQYAATVCAESRGPNGDRVWAPDVVTPCSRRASHDERGPKDERGPEDDVAENM
jgi:hypothetical protein